MRGTRRFGIKQRAQPFTAADEARWQANAWQRTYYAAMGPPLPDYALAAQAKHERDEYRRRACALEQGVDANG